MRIVHGRRRLERVAIRRRRARLRWSGQRGGRRRCFSCTKLTRWTKDKRQRRDWTVWGGPLR